MASSSIKNLTININADASKAKKAFEDIAQASLAADTQIKALGKNATATMNAMKSLGSAVKAIGSGASKDIFGLNNAERRISKIKTSLTGASKMMTKGSKQFDDNLDRVLAKATKLKKTFSKPITLFTVGSSASKSMDKMSALMAELKADRTDRRALIREELNLLRAQKDLIRAQRGIDDHRLKNQQKLNSMESSRLKMTENILGVSGRTVKSGSGQLLNLKTSLDRNTAAITRNSNTIDRWGRSYVTAEYARTFGEAALAQVGHLQEKRARVQAWNLDRVQQAMWRQQAGELLRNNKFITAADAESMMMAAASSIGHYDPRVVGQTVQQVTKYAQMERAMGYNKSEIDDIAKNYYGVAEARQVVNDIAATLKTFETVFRITTTTSGKITVADVETILRNMGSGAATISDEGLLRLLAYAEQIKIAGRGSSGSTGAGISTVGTNVKMLQLMAMGKPSSIGAKRMMSELGIMEDSLYRDLGGGNFAIVLEGNETEANKEEREFARNLFERGAYDQITSEVAIGPFAALARGGAFNKELAQQDPVLWVERLIPLIKQYTAASESRRREYYGAYADEFAEQNKNNKALQENAQAYAQTFIESLSSSQNLSAMTTFWAKTGLSQRVVTALTTFSNEAFQHRSEAMLQTARNQRSADELMQMQIDDGNVNLAILRIQKSFQNLAQSMEPVGQMVAQLTFWFADFVDVLTRWVRDNETLVKASSILMAVRTTNALFNAVGMGIDFDKIDKDYAALQAQKARQAKAKNKKGKKQTDQAVNSSFVLFSSQKAFDDNSKQIKTLSSRLKSFTTVTLKWGARLFSVAGWGLMAVDLASIFFKVLSETTQFGKDLKTKWDSIVNSIASSPIVLNMRYGDGLQLSDQQQTQLNDLRKRESELSDIASTNLEEGATYEDYKRKQSASAELETVRAQIKELETLAPAVFSDLNRKIQQADNELQKQGINKLLESLKASNDEVARLDQIVTMSRKNYESNNNDSAFAQLQKDTDNLEAEIKKRDAISKALSEKVADDNVRKAFDDISQTLVDYGGQEIGKALANNVADWLNKYLNVVSPDYYISGKDVARNAKGGVDSDPAGYTELANARNVGVTIGDATLTDNRRYIAGVQKRNEEIKKATGDSKELTTVKALNSTNKLISYYARLLNQREDLLAASNQRGFFEEDEDLRKRMESELRQTLASGRFQDKATKDMPFLPTGKYSTEEGVYQPEDFDLNMKDPKSGLTGYQIRDAMVLNEQLRMFNTNFRSALKTAQDSARNTGVELSRALGSIGEVNAAGAESSTYSTFKSDLSALQDRFARSGVADIKANEINQVLRSQNMAGLNIARQGLAQQQATDVSETESARLSVMTNFQQQDWQYQRQIEIVEAQHAQRVAEIREALANTLATLTSADGETRERLVNETNAQIEEAEQQHQERLTAMAQQYNSQRYQMDNLSLHNLMENWTDLGSQMSNFQTEMMEGFVEANEAWLDGDLDSWRDYANSLIKLYRNMVLKQGYSQLLGMFTEKTTNVMTDFIAGAFNLPVPNRSGTSGPAQPSGVYNFANGIWSGLGLSRAVQPTAAQPAGQSLIYAGGQVAASSTQSLLTKPLQANGATPMNRPYGAVMGMSYSTPQSLGLGSGGADVASQLSGFGAEAQVATEGLTTLATTGDLLNTTQAGLNATQLVTQGIEQGGQIIEQTSQSMESQAAIQMSAFSSALTAANTALIQFTTTLQTSGSSSMANGMGGMFSSMFANGGIMTSAGPLPLKTYSNGGIARRAQVAVYGEGSQPEAYVPLPDGRTIPVTMSNSGGTMNGNNVNISINVTNNAESSSTSGPDSASEGTTNMKKLANNLKALVKQEIYNQSRPGGLLYNGGR